MAKRTRVRIVGLAGPEAVRVESLLREQGFEVLNSTEPDGDDILTVEPARLVTPRQQEILCALAQHGSARAMAAALGLSTRTINAHLDHIYRRTGVHGRQAILCWACQRGLVDPADCRDTVATDREPAPESE